MNHSVEKGEKSTLKITLELDSQEWNAAIDEAYNKTKGQYSKQGFRKGHVPKAVLENTYGKSIFFEDAINCAFPRYYSQILSKDESIKPVEAPEISVQKISDDGVTLLLEVPVRPEVKLGKYKGIKFTKVEYNVTDSDVQAEEKRLIESRSRETEVTDRAAADGDAVTVDFVGKIDGKAFDGGSAQNSRIVLGSGRFIPGFEEGIVGMNIGETRDIDVKFPDDYGAEELKGKDAVFTITLHAIAQRELPEMTDEFIKEAVGAETVEEYRKNVRERLENNAKARANAEIEKEILDKLIENCEVELPDALVERRIDDRVEDMREQLSRSRVKLEDYLMYMGKTVDDLRESYRKEVVNGLKARFILEAVTEAENLAVTEEDKRAELERLAAESHTDYDALVKEVSPAQMDAIEDRLVVNKFFDFIKANNKIV